MRKLGVAALVSLFIIFSVSITSRAGVISPDLQSILSSLSPSEQIPVIINLSDKANLSLIQDNDKELRRSMIIQALKEAADLSQGPIKAFLQNMSLNEIIPLWIINGIEVTAPAWAISWIATFPGVDSVIPDYIVEAPPITVGAAAPAEWNISAIRAPELWSVGISGAGVVVANMDTGVDPNHADLVGKWRGGTNSWFNPYSLPTNSAFCATSPCSVCETNSTTPCDIHGHGTGTMGVIVGDSAGGTAIGVAPDAKWIAVKVLNDAGTGASSTILQGFQWILGLPSGQVPDVVNISWGLPNPNGCNLTFQTSIQALKAAGISVVFAAGNNGPNPATSISPPNNPGSFAVGTTDINNNIASFSSRGPSACDGTIFPHVVAPGVNIKIAAPTSGGLFPNSYVLGSGTSFSAPHAAGAMALLSGALPILTPTQLESILEQTAFGLGTPVPNNDYGYGLVDIANAYKNAFNTINGNIPEIASLPASYNFGNVEILASPSNLFTIVNRGIGDLSITNISVTGPNSSEFVKQIAGDTCSGQIIPSLSSCTVPVALLPTSVGPKSAALSIQSNDPVQPLLDLPLSASVFTVIPGTTISSPALAWNPFTNKMHIVVRGFQNDTLWAGTFNADGSFNSTGGTLGNGWTQILYATTIDAPGIASNQSSNKLHIVIRGSDNTMEQWGL